MSANINFVAEPKVEKKLDSFSIKGAMKSAADTSIVQPKQEINPQILAPSQSTTVEKKTIEVKPFTEDNLKYFWTSFSKRFENQDVRLFNILSSETLSIKNESEIYLGLFNSLQIDQFEKIKPQLVSFLIANLENRNITINTYILENIEIAKPLSLNEKYENMIQKNKLLKEFKERLNLDFD